MKVLVTGATGFIGRNILFALLDAGHSVLAVIRAESERDAANRLGEITNHPAALAIRGDLRDPDMGLFLHQLHGVDCIIHTAAEAKLGRQNFKLMHRAHVGATGELAALAISAQIPRFIYLSTAYVIPQDDEVLWEVAPGRGIGGNVYETTKTAAEHSLAATYTGALDIVRPGIVLPSRDRLAFDASLSPLGQFAVNARWNQLLSESDGAVRPGFVAMEDVVRLVVERLHSNQTGCRYFNLVDKPFTLAELAGLAGATLNGRIGRTEQSVSNPWRPYLSRERRWECSTELSRIDADLMREIFDALGMRKLREAA